MYCNFRRMIQTKTKHGLSWGGEVGLEVVQDKDVDEEEENMEVV